MIAQTTPELIPHSFALKFPPLSEKDRTALKADIASNGLLSPIIVNEKSEILDGRHRYEICRELGLEPRVVQLFELLGGKQVNEIDFIFSANFHRRHLTDDQRVAIFAEFLPQLRKEAQENLKSTQIMGRLKGGTPIKKRRWEVDVPLKQGGVRIKLANLANVGAGKAQRTIVIAGRNPELLAQVSRGEKKLETAYNEVVGDQLAPSATESPPKALEVQVLERKVDKWLARFLSGFDPSQRPEVLRLICDFCKTRIEKLSGS